MGVRAGPHPQPRSSALSIPGTALVALGFFVLMLGTVVAAITGLVHPVVPPLIGSPLLLAGGLLLYNGGSPRSPDVGLVRLRQDGGVIRLGCPGCGTSLGKRTSARGVVRCGACRAHVLVP